jgi:hypothetical protein
MKKVKPVEGDRERDEKAKTKDTSEPRQSLPDITGDETLEELEAKGQQRLFER